MRKITLEPIPESPEFYEDIEREIIRVLRRALYLPILSQFTEKPLQNAVRSGLMDALLAGTVTYHRGVFSGKFSAAITRELRSLGARWDRRGQCFHILLRDLPDELQQAVTVTRGAFERKLREIDERLAKIVPEELAGLVQTEKSFDRSIFEMDRRVSRSMGKLTGLRKASKKLQVGSKLTAAQRKVIAAEWQNNMKLWITDFTTKEIKELRTRLQDSVFRGNRYESAIRTIQDSYGVTTNKARFLASQETRLLLCKFKAIRYQDAGVRNYKWKCVTGTPRHPVRPRHRELNNESMNKGKLFRFDQPPVSTSAGQPTRRNNPGEDYNCRCVAIPVVDFHQ